MNDLGAAGRLGAVSDGVPPRPEKVLSEAEFLMMRDKIGLFASAALGMDAEALDAFIRQCDRADTLGPFLDPTMWRDRRGALARMRDHARAFAEFRRSVSR